MWSIIAIPCESGDFPSDPPGLETLSEDLRNDRDIVLAAVPGMDRGRDRQRSG